MEYVRWHAFKEACRGPASSPASVPRWIDAPFVLSRSAALRPARPLPFAPLVTVFTRTQWLQALIRATRIRDSAETVALSNFALCVAAPNPSLGSSGRRRDGYRSQADDRRGPNEEAIVTPRRRDSEMTRYTTPATSHHLLGTVQRQLYPRESTSLFRVQPRARAGGRRPEARLPISALGLAKKHRGGRRACGGVALGSYPDPPFLPSSCLSHLDFPG